MDDSRFEALAAELRGSLGTLAKAMVECIEVVGVALKENQDDRARLRAVLTNIDIKLFGQREAPIPQIARPLTIEEIAAHQEKVMAQVLTSSISVGGAESSPTRFNGH